MNTEDPTKVLERVVAILNGHDKSINKLGQSFDNWTSATTKHVVNIVDRVCKLENANPIVSVELKNAILRDFDNLFVRVSKLEEQPAVETKKLEEKTAEAAQWRIKADKLAEELHAVRELKNEWQQEAVASRVKLDERAKKIDELIHKLDLARQERDIATANEAGHHKMARDWQKEALESRDLKVELAKKIDACEEEIRSLKKANSQLFEQGVGMYNEIEAKRKEIKDLKDYCITLSQKVYRG